MGNFDFTGLSTSSFESLAQALAVKVLGAGTIIFGAGPDGGREATYEGRVSYPSAAEQWDGYIVLQAKFRQRLTDRETDAEWAIKLLREELDKYVEGKGGRRAPDYYILVTNVVLTPVQKKGGKDRVTKVFNDYRKKLPIKGWRVWDYDQLSTFLDAEESVRRAFTAFITSGDVLAEVMQWLKPARADFEEVMTGYLSRELNNAKHADLEQSGNYRILLSRVFVDLPLYKERLAEPPDEAEKPLDGVVATIIEAARERLDHSYRVGRSVAEDPVIARFVMVGGPGQGKTTAGQFACQLFRAAILKDRRGRLTEELVTALDEIITISEREEIELPRARRFPLHVVLRDFATALNRRKSAITGGQPLPELTLFGYLVDRIGGRTDQKVTADDFRAWLRAYPWLLVLDGLDEVPSASNRGDVLQAIEEFWMEATQANADLLMIATTRPQDYQDDFSPVYYAHRWLAPLSPARALRYGKRLLEVRHGTDSDRSAELFARMEKAAASESTARLMRTPLQITIMATLVETIGTPPQDRWRLFREYYGAIYRRERERTPSELLGKYESDINAIHYRTGLELQIMSESPGQTEARLSKEQFQAIVRGRLEEQGHEGNALERLVREIVAAAAYRLVFIVGLDVDQVGFEIRSLQEFMAAEALLGLGGDTATMQKRLRAIAGVQSWRNVFIFAAGRCFADLESLIDTIHAICRELNGEASVVAKAIQEGSMLALELLEDAAVGAKPKHARLLAETALELLSAPPGEMHARLAAAHSEAVDALYREEITRHLKVVAVGEQLGAWRTLLHLVDRGVAWAEELATTYWPGDDRALEIISAVRGAGGAWLIERVQGMVVRVPLTDVQHRDDEFFYRHATPSLRTVVDYFVGRGVSTVRTPAICADGKELVGFFFRVPSVESLELDRFDDLPRIADVHPSWRPVLALIQAGPALNARSLATFLEHLRSCGLTPDEYRDAARWLPWPAGVMLEDATPEALTERAAACRRGDYGDLDDWLKAEKRWKQRSLELRELNDMIQPLSRDIATWGYPYRICRVSISSNVGGAAAELARWFPRAADDVKARLATWLFFLARFSDGAAGVPVEVLYDALSAAQAPFFVSKNVVQLLRGLPLAPDFVDRAGRTAMARFGIGADALDFVIGFLRENPNRAGIVRVAAEGLRPDRVKLCRDTLPMVEATSGTPAHCRPAFATLNAVSGKYSDPKQLAISIAHDFPEDAERIADLLVAPYRPSDEELLLALNAELPPDAWRSRVSVRRTLENLQRSKPGPERGRAFWEELGFARVNLAG